MTAVERLARIEARAAAADEGPWEYWAETEEILARDGGIAEMTWPGRNAPNAAFIAHNRADVPWLVEQVRIRDAAIEAVLALHKPVWSVLGIGYECAGYGADLTDAAPDCPTVRAITVALDPS